MIRKAGPPTASSSKKVIKHHHHLAERLHTTTLKLLSNYKYVSKLTCVAGIDLVAGPIAEHALILRSIKDYNMRCQ